MLHIADTPVWMIPMNRFLLPLISRVLFLLEVLDARGGTPFDFLFVDARRAVREVLFYIFLLLLESSPRT